MSSFWAKPDNAEDDKSWMTISASSDLEYSSSVSSPRKNPSPLLVNHNCNDTNLDDTIPLDDLDEKHVQVETKNPVQQGSLPPDFLLKSVKSEAFCKMRANPSTEERRFSIQVEHHQLPQSTSSVNPPLSSIHLRQGSDMSDFRPPLCSSAVKDSSFNTDFKPQLCSTRVTENVSAFAPLRCSTGLNDTATFNPLLSSTAVKLDPGHIAEFKNLRVGSDLGQVKRLTENVCAFVPLRCSTGLNDTATFNPLLSSTAVKLDPGHIAEFKNLRVGSDLGQVKRLTENVCAFVPLRCSTGLNDTATFNPLLSSTAVKLDPGDIAEFKNLRVGSELGQVKRLKLV